MKWKEKFAERGYLDVTNWEAKLGKYNVTLRYTDTIGCVDFYELDVNNNSNWNFHANLDMKHNIKWSKNLDLKEEKRLNKLYDKELLLKAEKLLKIVSWNTVKHV